MIDLTPLDVRKKREDFRRAVRGYDMGQVDAFLELVAERLEALVKEVRELQERAAAREERLSAYQEREKALNEALLAAQELREEARTQAQSQATLRLREAEIEAGALRERADRDVQAAHEKLDELRARRGALLKGLRATLESFMDEVELHEERLAAERAAEGGDGAGAAVRKASPESGEPVGKAAG